MPVHPDAMLGLYRSLLDGRRVLVVLDNVRGPDQARPLLPPSPDSLTIITSRSSLAGLVARDGAVRVSLDPLRPDDAVELFRAVTGAAGDHDGAPAVLSTLVRQCAYLPLTIRIAAEQAVARADLDLEELSEELAAGDDRLDAFSVSDEDDQTEVRNVFSWSYRALSADSARMFRLLGLHAGPEISTPAAAALAGVSARDARAALRSLVGVNMLEEIGRDRYRFHDLLRAYAAERARAEEAPADRTSAVRRELLWYLHTADAADRALAPARRHVPLDAPDDLTRPLEFARYDDAVSWCEAERANLVAAVEQAAADRQDDVAWKLPVALVTFFYLRRHRADRLSTTEIAVTAANRTGDRYAEAWSLICVGGAQEDLGAFGEAIEAYERARAICREIGDRQGEGMALENMASSCWQSGRGTEALDYGQAALAIWRDIADGRNEGITLSTLGEVCLTLNRLDEALAWFTEALPVCRATDRRSEGGVLDGFGEVYRRQGDLTRALDHYEQALTLRRELGDSLGEAQTLRGRGRALLAAGRPAEARASLTEALREFDRLADPGAEEVRRDLAGIPE